MKDCLFCQIINKEIPAKVVYENKQVISFKDINPQAPVHVLILPKKHITSLSSLHSKDKDIITNLNMAIPKIASRLNLKDGFRVIINEGKDGGQLIPHLHFHLLGGKHLGAKIVV